MLGPAELLKLKGAKDKFIGEHPRFMQFLGAVGARGIAEGTVIEVKITPPQGGAMTANIRATASDAELARELTALLAGGSAGGRDNNNNKD